MFGSCITGSQYRDSTTGTTQNPDTSQTISISANPFFYKHKSHEELRWQDYQFRNEGGAAINTSNTLSPPLTSVSHSSFLFPSNPFTQQFGFTDLNKEKSIDAHSLFPPSNPFARQPGLGNAHKEESVNVFSFPSPPFTSGGQSEGSKLTPYSASPEADGAHQGISPMDGKLMSISAILGHKSHEELRLDYYHLRDIGGAAIGTSKTFGPSVTSANRCSSLFPSNTFTRQIDFVDRLGGESVNVVSSPSFPSNSFALKPGFVSLHKGASVNVFSSPSSSSLFCRQPGFGDLHKGESINTSNTLSPPLTSFNHSSSLFSSNPFTQQFGFTDINKGKSVEVHSLSSPSNPFARQPGFGNIHKEESVNAFSFPPFTSGGGSTLTPYTATPEAGGAHHGISTQTTLDEKPMSISAMLGCRDKSHEELRLEYYRFRGIGAAGIDTSKTSSANCCSSLFPSNPFTRQIDFVDRHGGESVNVVSSSFPSNSFAPQPGFDNLCKGKSVNVFSSPSSSSLFGRQPVFGDLHKGESVNFFSSPFPSNNPFTRQPGFADLNKGESANVPSPLFPSTPWSQCSYTPSIFDSPHLPDNAILKKVGGISAQHDQEPVSISAMPAFKDKSHEELRLEYYHAQGKGAAAIGTSTTFSPSVTYASCCSCFFPPNPFTRQMDFVDQLGGESVNVVSSSSFPSNSFALQPVSCTKVRGEPNKDSNPTTPNENAIDVSKLLPKLGISDYYTKPEIKELEAKERADPGFCSHVKDFLVGRHGYGSIKFLGETDVRNLDIEAHVRFNEREVIVYTDESKKPKIGEGLNKPAEICLVNIKCIDPKTGKQYADGPKVDKYRELLKKAAAEEGSEFVSYDPVQGEVKFKVSHF